MEIRVKVKVVRKRSGRTESYIIHIPRIVYEALGRPRYIVYRITPDRVEIVPEA